MCRLVYICIHFYSAKQNSIPFELEWMEGGSVDHVRRILSGLPLYDKPSLNFTPYTYTPLYFYISSVFSRILGVGFFPLRFLSFLTTIGCFYLVYVITFKQTGSKCIGIVCAGFYAATFKLNGFWFDIARVDSLMMFFVLWGIYFILQYQTRFFSVVGTSICILAAVMTKQVAFVIFLPLLIYILLKKPSRGLPLIVLFALFLLVFCIVQYYLYGEWFFFYTFFSPRYRWGQNVPSYAVLFERTCNLFQNDFLQDLFIGVILSVLGICHTIYHKRDPIFLVLFCSLICAAIIGRIEGIHYLNTLKVEQSFYV